MLKKIPPAVIHTLLFITTLITTTLAGGEWMFAGSFFFTAKPLGWHHFLQGFHFSIPFLLILSVHEFGHYFTAVYYKAKVTLPYYIPLWMGFLGSPSLGTAGAFIKIQSIPYSRKEFFDIGIAGPLAGFVAALGVLFYGFYTLPTPEYIFTIHPEYTQYGLDYARHVYNTPQGQLFERLGDNLLMWLFKTYIAPDAARVPNPYELMHYPYLFAGFWALIFTSINLLPVGQLDGGHVLYGVAGARKHALLSPIFFTAFILFAGWGVPVPLTFFSNAPQWEGLLNNLGYLALLAVAYSKTFQSKTSVALIATSVFAVHYLAAIYLPGTQGYSGWLLFALLVGRFLGIYHPETLSEKPIGPGRMVLAGLALLVFILCFTPRPFIIN